MPHKMTNIILWLCLSVVIIVPFSNDMFISALPIMRDVFNTNHVGLSLTVFLAGLAVAQPIYGPLSDRFGRKPVLLAGLIIFLLGSLITISSINFNLFLCGRFVQALGACASIITCLAVVRDTQHETKLAKAIGIMMAVIGICPAVAPLFGSYLTHSFGWKANFFLLFGFGLFYTPIIAILFQETAEKNLHAGRVKQIIKNYKTIFSNQTYAKFCLISALSYGTLFSFFSLAAIYIVHLYKISLVNFGWLILINGLIIFLSSIIVPQISKRYSAKTSVTLGASFIAIGACCMLLLNIFATSNAITFLGPMLIITLGIGFIRPSAAVGALRQTDKKIAGTASAGFNFCSFVGGAIATSFSGHLHLPLDFAGFALALGIIATALAITISSPTAPA